MIKIKTEVNKSVIIRELQVKATEGFKNSQQSELQVQAYMNGVHDLFKLLRLDNVAGQSEQLKCLHFNWCKIKNKDNTCRKNCKHRNI